MRRKDREITDLSAIKEIIDACDVIRLGFCDGDSYPYIVPMNFACVVEGGTLCFYVHGAMAGRKYALMQKNGVCSFEMDCGHAAELLPEIKNATMRYKSVMGKASIKLLDDAEKEQAMDLIMAWSEITRGADYDKTVLGHTAVARLTVTEYSAKANAR